MSGSMQRCESSAPAANAGNPFSGRLLEGRGSALKEKWQKIEGAVYGAAVGTAFFHAMLAVAHAPRGAKIAVGVATIAASAFAGHRWQKGRKAEKERKLAAAINEILEKTVNTKYTSESEFYKAVLLAATKGVGDSKNKLPFDRAAMFKVANVYDDAGKKKKIIKGIAIVNGRPDIEGFEIEVNEQNVQGRALLPWVVENGRIVLIKDTSKTEFELPGFKKFFDKIPKSILAIPLKYEGNVIGVLTFDNYHRHKRIPEEILEPAAKLARGITSAIVGMRSKITDYLTGAYNRLYLDRALAKIIEDRKNSKTPFSLIMLDIDKFKEYNDENGHLAGDELLVRLVDIARRNLHETDIICRWAGDEFVIVLSRAHDSDAVEIASRLREKFSDELGATVTIGVVRNDRRRSVEGLIKAADDMLRQGKKGGRNRVHVE